MATIPTGRPRVLVAALAGVLLVTGCSGPGATAGMPTRTATSPSTTATIAATPTATASGPSTPASGSSTPAQPPVALPTRVRIQDLGIDASVIPEGINADGTVEVPTMDQLDLAGWYTGSPRPGEIGPAVLLGHVSGRGRDGVFAALDRVRVGDRVDVERADGSSVTYAVTRVESYKKAEFPTEQVYGDVATPELRLITCGGTFDWDTHHYDSNLVVYAVRI